MDRVGAASNDIKFISINLIYSQNFIVSSKNFNCKFLLAIEKLISLITKYSNFDCEKDRKKKKVIILVDDFDEAIVNFVPAGWREDGVFRNAVYFLDRFLKTLSSQSDRFVEFFTEFIFTFQGEMLVFFALAFTIKRFS